MQELRETRVQALGWEDPLEKEIATHSSILAGTIPRTEEPGGLKSRESQASDMIKLPSTQHTQWECGEVVYPLPSFWPKQQQLQLPLLYVLTQLEWGSDPVTPREIVQTCGYHSSEMRVGRKTHCRDEPDVTERKQFFLRGCRKASSS